MDRRNVEDIYPLSPLQQGMLFHVVYSEGAAYQEQFPLLLTGELDADALERAFGAVVARHGALRTGFGWEGVPQPLQFVLRQAEPVFDRVDWSDAAGDWRPRLDALMADDRRRGHDLKQPPLARITLARIDARRHVMLLSMHHMIVDGWSLPLVVGELYALYSAERTGHPAALPPAPRYRDYVQWLLGRDAAAAEAFWRGALAGFHRATPLPLDAGPRAAGAGRVKATLDADPALMERAQAFARAEGVTLNTLAQAAWALLLARHAAVDDVLFGATVSGRPPEIAGVERTVGLFINTVPVRVRLDGGARVGEWLRQVQRTQVETRRYEYARLVDVHGWSEVPRESALFDSLLVFENYPVQLGGGDGGDEGDAPALHAESLSAPESTNYALTLICAPIPGAFQFRLAYDPARFTAGAAGHLLAGVEAALGALVAGAAGTVGALSIVPAAERAALERLAHGPALEFDPAATLHGAFARHAAAAPGAPAVDDGRVRWTYAELDAVTRGVAARLRARGVGPGSRVGVAMEPGAWRIAAMLAAVRTGAAYVPLDLAYPAGRLAYMLDDSGIAALLADDAVPASLASFRGATLRLPADAELATLTTNAEFVDAAGDGRGEAYVVYTSGSTGRPKGIAVPHRAVLRMAADPGWRCGPGDRVAQVTGASFDPMAFEVWGALAAGAAVVPFDRETVLDAPAFARGLATRGVTAMFLSTGLFNQVARAVPHAFNPLRYVMVGGEAVDAHAFRAVLDAGGPRLINAYGPAEATIYAATHDVTDAGQIPQGAASVPIGAPVVGTVARVMDAGMRLLPAGATGELCLGGAALAHGYVGQPALTAERFVPDPLAAEPGARLYRTGDRARWTEVRGPQVRECERANVRTWDGEDDRRDDAVPSARTHVLEYLGRLDDQVKVRGYRVEPGEIVAVLRTHPAVAGAFVAPRPDASGGQRLVAWVLPAAGGADGFDALRAHLGARLPEWMVPADWVRVEQMPLTANGKVDRAALPEPGAPGSAAGEHVEPRTETERELAAIWREVLKADRVGAGDTFLALGGHSLMAMQVVTRIEAQFGVQLPLRALFETPRLADLAAAIDAELEAALAELLAEEGEL